VERPGHHRPQPRRRLGCASGRGPQPSLARRLRRRRQPGRRQRHPPHPGSIGYAEDSYTAGTAINSAAIANRDGNYVTPTPAAITADAAAKPAITPEDFSIVDEPGADAYPISGYSWVLVSASQSSQSSRATGKALVSLLGCLTGPGQSYAAALGYVPLPHAVQQLAAATPAQVTGPGSQPLTG